MRKEIGVAKSRKTNRKYDLDENIFSELNEKSAYWIGFLYGDGNCTTENKIRITLQWNDREHIMKFRNFIKSNNRPIKHLIKEGIYNNAHLEFRSWKIHNILKQYELTTTKDKRRRLHLKLLQPGIRKHFFRGLFDADGSVYIEKSGLLRTEITGYMPILIDFKNTLVIDSQISEHKNIIRNGNTIFRLRFGQKDSIKLLNYLYGERPFYYLKRKYDMSVYHLERLNELTTLK